MAHSRPRIRLDSSRFDPSVIPSVTLVVFATFLLACDDDDGVAQKSREDKGKKKLENNNNDADDDEREVEGGERGSRS